MNTHDMWKEAAEKMKKEREEDSNDKKQSSDLKNKSSMGRQIAGSSQQSIKDKSSDATKEDENTSSDKKDDSNKNPKSQNLSQKQETSAEMPKKLDSSSQQMDENALKDLFEKNFLNENKKLRDERAQEVLADLTAKRQEYQRTYLEKYSKEYDISGDSKEVADWRKLLKKAIEKEDTYWSYRRSNRSNDYMARAEEFDDPIKSETEVLLDVSGSVTEPMLRGFLHQLRPLLKHTTFKVGCFDSEFFGFTEIKKQSDIDRFQIEYTGGWENFDNAVRQFSKKKEVNKIIFTDGGNPPGKMPMRDLKNVNVIWIVTYNRSFSPCCGQVIFVPSNELFKSNVNYVCSSKQSCVKNKKLFERGDRG